MLGFFCGTCCKSPIRLDRKGVALGRVGFHVAPDTHFRQGKPIQAEVPARSANKNRGILFARSNERLTDDVLPIARSKLDGTCKTIA